MGQGGSSHTGAHVGIHTMMHATAANVGSNYGPVRSNNSSSSYGQTGVNGQTTWTGGPPR